MAEELLNPTRQIFSVLGVSCINPALTMSKNFIDKEDVVIGFHKVVVMAITNIIANNSSVKSIDPIDIDNYLQNYPKYYAIWKKNDGVEYVSDAIEVAKPELYEHDLDVVKKYTLLRSLINNGIDITDLFDYKSEDINVQNEGVKVIEEMDSKEIIDKYTSKLIDIRNDINNLDKDMVKFSIKDDIDSLLERLQEHPSMGYPFPNGYYNTLFKGMRQNKFLLRSAASGGGKTRQSIRDMCNVGCDEIYIEGKGFESTGASQPILFISTELNKEELQILTIAYISGITSTDIESGNYDKTTLARLKKAIEIIQRSEMYFVYVDDFSIMDIEMAIKEHVIKYGINYCVFDYIQITGKLSKSIQAEFGHDLREDQIMLRFSDRLKTLSEELNIFLISSTQLNGNEKDDSPEKSRDSNAIRGGRSVVDKIDYGIITALATDKDLRNLKPILSERMSNIEPNYSHWVYKNRAGMNKVVIWSFMDLGNMRETPLFATDYNYNLVDYLTPTEVIMEEEQDTSEKVVF